MMFTITIFLANQSADVLCKLTPFVELARTLVSNITWGMVDLPLNQLLTRFSLIQRRLLNTSLLTTFQMYDLFLHFYLSVPFTRRILEPPGHSFIFPLCRLMFLR
jgi:hypothetical protein